MIKIEGRIYMYWLQTSATPQYDGKRMEYTEGNWKWTRGIENENHILRIGFFSLNRSVFFPVPNRI